MSTIFTSDSSLREQPTKETTQTDSSLRKMNDVLFSPRKGCKTARKYSFKFKQKVVNEVLLGKYKTHVAEKYHISYKTLEYWVKKACKPIPETKKSPKTKRYPLDFKQKVVSEVRLGKCKAHVAEKYDLCYQTIMDWTKKTSLPVEPIPKAKEPSKKRKIYSLDFKQKVVSEVRLGLCKTHAAEKYNLSYKTLVGWVRKACLPVEPIPETKESSKEEGYSLDFKQKVVSEVCLGRHISQVSKSYNICQSDLNIWLEKAYSPNFPYNSSAAWIDEL